MNELKLGEFTQRIISISDGGHTLNITLLNVGLLGRSFTGTAGHSAARLQDLAESIEIHNAEHGLTHLWALIGVFFPSVGQF